MVFKGHPMKMLYYFLNSLHKMACAYESNVGGKERSLFHHGIINILVFYRLGELGDSWESFLSRNEFGENEEWPQRRPKTK